ncbi:MAG TPA: Calx-beta domain-containing protein [Pyrinomonadaceae bacterium]|nr:Calx-beta domain-containing protein [Pyrinomonadaceae bacterium]
MFSLRRRHRFAAGLFTLFAFTTLTFAAAHGTDRNLFDTSLIESAFDNLSVPAKDDVVVDATAPTDYFRSFDAGSWASSDTWESSHDGTTGWITAASPPTAAANTITVRTGHTVTVSTTTSADQVIVESGAVLSASVQFSLTNGTGDEVTVQDGGIYNLNGLPTIGAGSTVKIQSGGILRVLGGGMTGANAGINGPGFVYQNASIVEYAVTTAFTTSNVTFFPNVDADTVPIFRVTATLSNVGAATPTAFNGVFEVVSGKTVSWAGAGTKTFRNGLRGAGTMTQGIAGQFLITGSTAELGGTGVLNLGVNGLQIKPGSVTVLTSDKTVNLNIITVAGTLNCGANALTGSGAFTLADGGTLGIGSASGITSAPGVGNIQVSGTRSFSSNANYVYDGNTNQIAGDQLPVSVQNLTIANTGAFGNSDVTGNNGQTVTSTLGVQAGSYSAGSANYGSVMINSGGSYSANGSLTVTGNWTNDGSFSANGNAVIFGSGSQVISGDTTFYDLTKTSGVNDTLTFAAGHTQTVTHAIALNGTLGNPLYLRSTVDGTSWNLIAPASQSVSFVDVKDSNAVNGTPVTTSGSTDSGNNINWIFPSGATVAFERDNYTEDESQTLNITVVRGGVTAGISTVDFVTSNGTATGGAACAGSVDYIQQNGTLTFGALETSKTIAVPICGDRILDPNEAFIVTLSNSTGAGIGTPASAAVTIIDTASQFRNSSPITINDSGPATPYASTIDVSGVTELIGSVRVTLYDLSHPFADDIDILLVGPNGQRFVLMADAGGANGFVTPATITLYDGAPLHLPDSGVIGSGVYRPTNWESTLGSFPGGPVGPYSEPGPGGTPAGAAKLNGVFGGTDANGVWNLYVVDDTAGPAAAVSAGSAAGGWGIDFVAPTAASAALGGRVISSDGRGIANAVVELAGGLHTSKRVTTGAFGYYRFEGLRAGETYVLTVTCKRFQFPIPTRTVNLFDDLVDVDFIGNSSW